MSNGLPSPELYAPLHENLPVQFRLQPQFVGLAPNPIGGAAFPWLLTASPARQTAPLLPFASWIFFRLLAQPVQHVESLDRRHARGVERAQVVAQPIIMNAEQPHLRRRVTLSFKIRRSTVLVSFEPHEN